MPRWSQLRDVLLRLVPKPLAEIIERGLLRAFLLLVAGVLVLPLTVVLLAAILLSAAADSNIPGIRGLRVAYLDLINKGFSIEEVAARSNVRLDYLQLFEYDLGPRNPSKEIRLGLNIGQKAAIDIRLVRFIADSPECTIPETDLELLQISLGGQSLRTLTQDSSGTTISIGAPWWQRHGSEFGEDDLVQRLTFRLADAPRHLACGKVHIEGGVQVYKDVYSSKGASN